MCTITTFELIPNEILLQCFEYLNGVDIFYSFDRLNYRLNKLIRSISLYVDFENIHQKLFDQFCIKLSLSPLMKKQIYSLHLSNTGVSCQMQPFLSQFSLAEFVHLRLLTLTKIENEDLITLKRMLPSLPELVCLHLKDYECSTDHIISTLSMPKLQTVKISYFPIDSQLIPKLSFVTHLTLDNCYLASLLTILRNLSLLKYLNIRVVMGCHYNMSKNSNSSSTNLAIHLHQLIFMSFGGQFADLKMILKPMVNLKRLTVCTSFIGDIFDAIQWEEFIRSSLIHLKIFNFKFEYHYCIEKTIFEKKLQEFQNDFWQKEHHWYTEYSISNSFALIYTIPYISTTYRLQSSIDIHRNESINSIHTFDNVTHLIVDLPALTERYSFGFSHVSSICLHVPLRCEENFCFHPKQIQYLQMIVNLCNVTHLTAIFSLRFDSSIVLLEIFKQAKQLSSLIISRNSLLSIFENTELWKYLNPIMKKLVLDDSEQNSFDNSKEVNQFCQIFSNLEQLTCTISDKQLLFFLINNLPKVSSLTARLSLSDDHHEFDLLREELRNIGVKYSAKYDDDIKLAVLLIWINRDV